MQKIKSKSDVFEVAVLGSWAAYFLFVLVSKRLPLYINPKFSVLPWIGMSVLVAMIVATRISNPSCCKKADHDWSFLAWFLMPILMSVLFPPAGLGAFVASTRQAEMLKGNMTDSNISLDLSRSAQYKDIRLDELVSAGRIVAGKVTVVGQTLVDSNATPDECMLAHYVMVCCAADLRPVGIVLKYPAGYTPQHGKWVRVRGTVSRESQGIVLRADSIEPIREPNPPYLY